jgi:dephospho-CoA kinase
VSILTVALTGGIATGKSYVARLLADYGCFVQAADSIGHDLIKPGRPAWEEVVGRFGTGILNPDRTINRRRLGAIIFSSARDREFLNKLIHPLVLARKKAAVRRLEKKSTCKIFVSEAALTIEAGFAPFFDKIIVVHCSEKLQVDRLVERDGISRDEARKRIRSQLPTAAKIKCADYLIETSGSEEQTAAQTRRVFRHLLADFRKKQAARKKASSRSRRQARRREAGP